VSERRRRGLPDDLPDPRLHAGLGRAKLLELEQQLRIAVARKQSVQQPAGELERAAFLVPTQLDQPAVLMNRADILDAGCLVGRDTEQIAAPDARVLLLLGDLAGRRVGLELGSQGVKLRRIRVPEDLGKGAIPDGRAAVLDQPGNGDPMRRGKGQALLPGGCERRLNRPPNLQVRPTPS
jgi:hypothetical protein